MYVESENEIELKLKSGRVKGEQIESSTASHSVSHIKYESRVENDCGHDGKKC